MHAVYHHANLCHHGAESITGPYHADRSMLLQSMNPTPLRKTFPPCFSSSCCTSMWAPMRASCHGTQDKLRLAQYDCASSVRILPRCEARASLPHGGLQHGCVHVTTLQEVCCTSVDYMLPHWAKGKHTSSGVRKKRSTGLGVQPCSRSQCAASVLPSAAARCLHASCHHYSQCSEAHLHQHVTRTTGGGCRPKDFARRPQQELLGAHKGVRRS